MHSIGTFDTTLITMTSFNVQADSRYLISTMTSSDSAHSRPSRSPQSPHKGSHSSYVSYPIPTLSLLNSIPAGAHYAGVPVNEPIPHNPAPPMSSASEQEAMKTHGEMPYNDLQPAHRQIMDDTRDLFCCKCVPCL